MRVPLALAALLYGLASAWANAAALDADGRAALDVLRQGDMAKLVVHEEPKALMEEIFHDAEGGEVRLADFAGKVVLVNFWATWCPPCRAEMPSIDRLSAEMAGEDFAVVPVSTDRGGAPRVVKFFEGIGVANLPLYLDARSRLAGAAGAVGLPVTLLLDREGREVARVTGDAEWDSPEAKALIGKLIELTTPQG